MRYIHSHAHTHTQRRRSQRKCASVRDEETLIWTVFCSLFSLLHFKYVAIAFITFYYYLLFIFPILTIRACKCVCLLFFGGGGGGSSVARCHSLLIPFYWHFAPLARQANTQIENKCIYFNILLFFFMHIYCPFFLSQYFASVVLVCFSFSGVAFPLFLFSPNKMFKAVSLETNVREISQNEFIKHTHMYSCLYQFVAITHISCMMMMMMMKRIERCYFGIYHQVGKLACGPARIIILIEDCMPWIKKTVCHYLSLVFLVAQHDFT